MEHDMKSAEEWHFDYVREVVNTVRQTGKQQLSGQQFTAFIADIQRDAIEAAAYEVRLRYPLDKPLLGVFEKFLGQPKEPSA